MIFCCNMHFNLFRKTGVHEKLILKIVGAKLTEVFVSFQSKILFIFATENLTQCM